MNKLISFCIAILATTLTLPAHSQDSVFDELTLNGLSSFQKLRKEYYIGALYLESSTSNQDADTILNMPGNKRMDIRVVVDEWSPRRFAKEWTGTILLNNEQSSLEKLTTQIQSFTGIPTDNLIRGDRITIDMAEGRHTTVYLNNSRVFRTTNNQFFYAVLNSWIGSKPPSTDFKQDILRLPRDEDGADLLTRYEGIQYTDSRKRQVMAWSKSAKSTGSAIAGAAFAPPGSSSAVKVSANALKTGDDKATKAAAAKKSAEQKAAANALAKSKTDAAKLAAAQASAAASAEALRQVQADAARNKALGTYQSEMYRLIAKNVKYPKRSQQRGERGRAVVKVELDREGKIVNLIMEEPTQFARLNTAAEKAFKVSEPFAPMPEELTGETFEFIFPINF